MSDDRERCDRGHLICQGCGSCACDSGPELDSTSFPAGVVKVSTAKNLKTLCRECRYQDNELGGVGKW